MTSEEIYAERSELEARADRFIKRYMKDADKPLENLSEDCQHRLYGILLDRGYEKKENGMYIRVNEPHDVEIFLEKNLADTSKEQLKQGYSYLKLDRTQDIDFFEVKYSNHKKNKHSVGSITASCILGAAALGFCGFYVTEIVTQVEFIAQTVMAGLLGLHGSLVATTTITDIFKNKKINKKREDFLDTYGERIITGNDAIVAALGRYSEVGE